MNSIYIHIPFCQRRCGYCDFNTFSGQLSLLPKYTEALSREIFLVAKNTSNHAPVHTIYFGGGTPSLLPLNAVQKITHLLNDHFPILSDAEISFEANPGTISLPYLNGIRGLGINRISFGFQSTDPQILLSLDRKHDFFDMARAYLWARQAGFRNISIDLIYGIPGQTLEKWKHTLELTARFHPEHLSLYSLTIEPGTPIFKWWKRGLLPDFDEDLAADMYDLASDYLEKMGYQQYEISNWALDSSSDIQFTCRHNIQYWRNLPYFGFGAGAHSSMGGFRMENVHGIAEYIQKLMEPGDIVFPFSPANLCSGKIDDQTEMEETMMVGLRLTQEGVSSNAFFLRFNRHIESVFGREIDRLCSLGLLEWVDQNGEHVRLTLRGRLLGNQVFMQFVGCQ